jgi:hypothetical protein
VRRNSPSVTLRRPTSSWNLTISAIASSSTARSASAEISPLAFLRARVEEALRAQEAADVVGAKRRVGAGGHGGLSSGKAMAKRVAAIIGS